MCAYPSSQLERCQSNKQRRSDAVAEVALRLWPRTCRHRLICDKFVSWCVIVSDPEDVHLRVASHAPSRCPPQRNSVARPVRLHAVTRITSTFINCRSPGRVESQTKNVAQFEPKTTVVSNIIQTILICLFSFGTHDRLYINVASNHRLPRDPACFWPI